jgi:hypothetical protein
MFEQAVIPIRDGARFAEIKAALEQLFASANAGKYLRRVQGAGLRVRDFEGVLGRGLLGESVAQAYDGLTDSDRGQVRELYLSMVERVAPELRAKFLKVYAYY